eukprot:c16521_g1_i1 orf=281-505(+)
MLANQMEWCGWVSDCFWFETTYTTALPFYFLDQTLASVWFLSSRLFKPTTMENSYEHQIRPRVFLSSCMLMIMR